MHFTHYWTSDTANHQEQIARRGERLEHVAGNLFRDRQVGPGDTIHVITFARGTLRVLGRMVVDTVVDTKTAERLLGTTDLYEATEHCIARKRAASLVRFDAVVPDARISAIEFADREGNTWPPARNSSGAVDPQTFRGVRRITPTTAQLLDDVLKSH